MADFAPNYTARYRIRYSTLGFEHSMLWRIGRDAGSLGLAQMIDKVGQTLSSLSTALFTDFIVISAEYAAEDVDNFVFAGLPTVTPGVAVIPPQAKSQSTLSVSFVGRSGLGHRARMFLWGCNASPESAGVGAADDFRLFGTESPPVAAAIAELNSGSPSISGNDNSPVFWYNYVNTKYSDHWVPRVRG